MPSPPLPPFCRPRAPTRESRYNAEAATAGTIGGWGVPAGSLVLIGQRGDLQEFEAPCDVTLAGIAFAAHKRVGFVWGRPWRGTLAADTVLSGIPCQGGVETQIRPISDAWFPLDASLAADTVLDGIPCAAGTRFQFLDNSSLVSFTPARDVLIDGVPCAGGRPARRNRGRLAVATLAQDCTIDGVPCAAGGPVHLGEHGLTHALLQARWTARGVTWRAGTLVSGRLRVGEVTGGTPDEDAVIDGFPCAGGHPLRRGWKRKRLIEFTLSQDAVVDGFPCLGATRVSREGLRQYALSAPKRIAGVTFERADVVSIDDWDDYDAGEAFVRIASPRTLRGRTFPTGCVVHPHGCLVRKLDVRLGEAMMLDGVTRPAGTLVVFGRAERVANVFEPKGSSPAYR